MCVCMYVCMYVSWGPEGKPRLPCTSTANRQSGTNRNRARAPPAGRQSPDAVPRRDASPFQPAEPACKGRTRELRNRSCSSPLQAYGKPSHIPHTNVRDGHRTDTCTRRTPSSFNERAPTRGMHRLRKPEPRLADTPSRGTQPGTFPLCGHRSLGNID